MSDRSPQGDAQKSSEILSGTALPVRSTRYYEFERFRLDARRRVLMRDGALIAIQPKALDVLLLLVQQRGRLVAKEELMRRLWPDTIVEEANLAQNVFIARKALGESPDEHRFITTVARQGYCFVGDVRELADEHDAVDVAKSPAASDAEGRRPVRLAVLPFMNLTGDPTHDYLAEGLAVETMATLGQLDPIGLVVIGRTTMLGYRRTSKSIAEIGREVDAAYLLESSIRAEHDRLRVTSVLVRTRDHVQIWSRSYERDLTSVLQLQKELSAGIAEQIRSCLSPQPAVAVARHPTNDPRAYDRYLRGLFAQRQRTAASNAAAIRFFEEAAALDPGFALAWCGIADIYASSGFNGDGAPAVIAPPARAAAARAAAADPDLSEALTAVGRVRFWFDWDWPGAETALQRAIAIDPGNVDALRVLGFVHSIAGRHAEGLAASERSVDMDPLNPINHAGASEVAFRRRDNAAAVTHAERSLELEAQFWIGYILAAQAQEQLEEHGRALENLASAQRLSGNNSKTISLRGYILARTGRTREARSLLEELTASAAATYVPPYAAALIHAGLGDADATFDWLERARTFRDVHLALLMIDPKWNSLRGDPRFASLLARCGFTA